MGFPAISMKNPPWLLLVVVIHKLWGKDNTSQDTPRIPSAITYFEVT